MEDVIGWIVPKGVPASDPYVAKVIRLHHDGVALPFQQTANVYTMIRRPDNGNAKQS